jgi:single-stranded DNA-binding protein
MIDPNNNLNLTCGVVAEPEMPTENIAKFRVAVDYAGSEKGSDNTTGYFDVTYYLNSDENKRNCEFVRNQISSGKMTKGSQIRLIGRLVQERWSVDGKNSSKVVIVAENITYASRGRSESTTTTGTAQNASVAESVAPSAF